MSIDNKIKILGAYGAKTSNSAMTCIKIDKHNVIDAGNIILGLEEDSKYINNIFITHSHMDHIIDIPFLIDLYFNDREDSLNLYGTKQTLQNIKEHILNDIIWPDFTKIKLNNSNNMAIKLIPIELHKQISINDNTKLKAIPNNHTKGSCAYVIEKSNHALLFSSDTYKSADIIDELNNNHKIRSLIIDISFPSNLEKLANTSKHLTPDILNKELKKLTRSDIKIFINHLKPSCIDSINEEIKSKYPNLLNGGRILDDNDSIDLSTLDIKSIQSTKERYKYYINQLIDVGYSLTHQHNFDKLMEDILIATKSISNADGGTLYMMNKDHKSLRFTVIRTDSLGIYMGGTKAKIKWDNVELFDKNNNQNKKQVASLCALTGEMINISDVYKDTNFDFSGTKTFDKGTGYRTKSMLVIPMKDHDNNIIGVIQLLNKKDADDDVMDFTSNDEKLISSMSSQAAVSITNKELIYSLEKLLLNFIKSTADAISEKSNYTGGHINRVAQISNIIAKAINDAKNGMYKNTNFTDDDFKQLDIASWMHDIGKITTPEYVVDKATKLETIYDRINEIKAKFEIYKRDLKIDYLTAKVDSNEDRCKELCNNYIQAIEQIEDDFQFIQQANKGSEFMDKTLQDRVKKIAKKRIKILNVDTTIINENELYNLLIQKGTLTQEEREIINNHVIVSYNMLKDLSFPKKLQRVPLIASSHHKTIYKKEDGTHGGYGAPEIMSEPMSIEDRILAVADVFEAVTASDRPYKQPNSLNQSLKILSFMVKDNELDRDIVKFFIDNKIYEEYAKDNLLPSQLDEVTVTID